MNKIKEELKTLSVEETKARVDSLKRDLFSLRLHAATSELKDKTQFKKLRKNIACALTYLRQKTLNNN